MSTARTVPVGDPPPERGTRPGNRRQLIVAAAAEQFYRRGYPDVSMADIATAVGVGPSALYRHFAGKEDVLAEVLATRMESFASAVRAARTSPEPVVQICRTAVIHRDLGVLWEREARHIDANGRREVARARQVIIDGLVEVVRTVRPSATADDAVLLAWILAGVLVSPSFQHADISDDDLVDLLAEMSAAALTATLAAQTGNPVERASTTSGAAQRSRREQLLGAAIEQFAAHGYQSVGIEDIAASVGLTGASIYSYFPAKHDILAAAMNRGAEWLRLDTNRALARSASSVQALANLAAANVDFVLDHTTLISLMLSETQYLPDPEARRIRDEQREHVDEWLRLLAVVHPDESREVARVRTQAALTIAHTCARTSPLTTRSGFNLELTSACELVLGVSGPSSPGEAT